MLGAFMVVADMVWGRGPDLDCASSIAQLRTRRLKAYIPAGAQFSDTNPRPDPCFLRVDASPSVALLLVQAR